MDQDNFSSQMVQSAIDIVTPVLENAVVLSGQYAKACGRNTILAKDAEYCMKYCAMNTVGDRIGSYFPEIYTEEESDNEDTIEVVDDEDEMFETFDSILTYKAMDSATSIKVGNIGAFGVVEAPGYCFVKWTKAPERLDEDQVIDGRTMVKGYLV